MAFPKPAQVQLDDQRINRIQDNLTSALAPVLRSAIVDGVLLKSVALANGTTQISHKLGRKLTGWLIVRQRGAAAVYDAQDSNASPDRTLALISSAAVTIDLWVF